MDFIFRLLRVEDAHNDEQSSASFVDDMILQTHVLGQRYESQIFIHI